MAERQRCQPSKLARRVRFPQGTLSSFFTRGSANGRLPGFEPGDAGSSPAPRTFDDDAGSSNGRTGRSERPDVGSIPAPATTKTTCALIRQSAERLGLSPSVCRFDSCSGHMRLGRQLADHLGLEPGMLWVRLPPELLTRNTSSRSSLECSPPCHGGDRRFKSDRGRLTRRGTQTGKAAKLKPSRPVGSTPTRATETCVGWALARLSGCNPPALGALQVQLLPGALIGPFV